MPVDLPVITIEVQFNILRTLVHRAIEVGIMEASKDPFLVFKYGGVKTTKEKLDDEEMQRIINLELPEGTLIWHCKNYFLFSYYCAGIRAADLIQLRWRNVTASGRLHYQMGKNHKERDLLLVDPAIDIPTSTRKRLQKRPKSQNRCRCTSVAILSPTLHKNPERSLLPSRIFSVTATLPPPSGIWAVLILPRPMKLSAMFLPRRKHQSRLKNPVNPRRNRQLNC